MVRNQSNAPHILLFQLHLVVVLRLGYALGSRILCFYIFFFGASAPSFFRFVLSALFLAGTPISLFSLSRWGAGRLICV